MQEICISPTTDVYQKTAEYHYHGPWFLDRQVYAIGVDSDETALRRAVAQSDLHCLPFRLHLLNALLFIKDTLFKF